jgi:DNA-binding beta-propeller fold protein YncE
MRWQLLVSPCRYDDVSLALIRCVSNEARILVVISETAGSKFLSRFWGNSLMKTEQAICYGVLLVSMAGLGTTESCRVAAAQSRSASVREIPKFQVDASWPKIPNGWTLGQVASMASDEKDDIWVLQRPRTVRSGQKPAPPVMEFDQADNYIQGWGGPGEGFDWPKSEHGIFVDYKGYVWIVGSGNDDQILKFTKAGKFVMQIGHGGHKKTNVDQENFWEPTDVFVYPKTNELFVADGYGNKRIIVFDADTGVYKRMWGAFGNVPTDGPLPAPESRKLPDANRVPAKDLPSSDPGPSQFNTVHGVKVSHDGLVYVADRGGRRVQVFTVSGKYLKQVFVDRWCESPGGSNLFCGDGQTAAGVAFSPDAGQRFLYVASRSPGRVWVYDRKTLEALTSFGRPGVAPGEFYVIHHIATDSKGNLYTAEVEDGRRVQKFIFKGIIPAPAK